MARRTVTPNSDLINERRTHAGLTIEKLAEMADVSTRRTQDACNNVPVGVEILRSIADALSEAGQKTRYEELLPGGQKRFGVTVVIEVDMADSDAMAAAAALVKKLTELLPAASEIVIRQVKTGSVIIELEMGEQDVITLVEKLPNLKSAMAEAIIAPSGPYVPGFRPSRMSKINADVMLLVEGIREIRIGVE